MQPSRFGRERGFNLEGLNTWFFKNYLFQLPTKLSVRFLSGFLGAPGGCMMGIGILSGNSNVALEKTKLHNCVGDIPISALIFSILFSASGLVISTRKVSPIKS